MFRLLFTHEARTHFQHLDTDPRKKKKVQKCLYLLQSNPRHPGLNSHKYAALKTSDGRNIWESYVENNTPSAWRVFWCYGPQDGQIIILSITEHP